MDLCPCSLGTKSNVCLMVNAHQVVIICFVGAAAGSAAAVVKNNQKVVSKGSPHKAILIWRASDYKTQSGKNSPFVSSPAEPGK